MRRSIALVATATLCWSISCGPKPESSSVQQPPTSAAKLAPSHLIAIAGDASLELRWQTNQPENHVLNGYNLYEAREDGAFQKITPMPYPGDLEERFDIETYTASGLDNGVRYSYTVSTVYPGGIEVFSQDTATATPRVQGAFNLTASFNGREAGFSFARSSSVATDDLANDMYLAVIKDRLHLASPERIDNVLRVTRFFAVKTRPGDVQQEPKLPTGDGQELITAAEADEIVILTADGCYALVKIEAADTAGKSVRISYLYQPRRGTFSF